MSALSRLCGRPVLTTLAAVVATVAAVTLFGSAVERVKEEAARTRRANNLDTMTLAYAGDLGGWSPVWGGADGAVPDSPPVAPAGSPPVFAPLTPRAVEPAAAAPAGYDDLPAHLPNRDLFEPVGVRDVRPTWRPGKVRIGAPSPEPVVPDRPAPRPGQQPVPLQLVPVTDAAIPLGVGPVGAANPSVRGGATAAAQ